MDTTAVRSYNADMYEEICRESRKEVTESNLDIAMNQKIINSFPIPTAHTAPPR